MVRKVKFILASAFELSETTDFNFYVQLCIETFCKRANLVIHLTKVFLEFFFCGFHRRCLFTFSITTVQKSKKKNDQNPNQGRGPAAGVNFLRLLIHRVFLPECDHLDNEGS